MSRGPKPTDFIGQYWRNSFTNNQGENRQAMTHRFYSRVLSEIACSRFLWKGMPERPEGDIRTRYMELSMLTHGLVVFFYHEKFGRYLCVRATPSAPLDMYGDPQSFQIYGNGMTPGIDGKILTADECVPIWSNALRVPEFDMMAVYIHRLVQFDTTIEINVKSLRHPFILVADEENRQSIQQMYGMIERGENAWMVKKSMADLKESIGVFDTKLHPDSLTNIIIDKRKIWNELLTYMGINNANQDKRERLVAAEVTANDSEVLVMRNTLFDARRLACEQINEKFGLDVSVEWNTNLDAMADMMIAQNQAAREGGDDGDIHDSDSATD